MALKQLTFDFRYSIPAFCSGTRGMVTLEREGRVPHTYTAVGVTEKELPLYEFARTCPECQRILKEHYADLERMDNIINGPKRLPVEARPVEPLSVSVGEMAQPIEDALVHVGARELEYAASGEQ